MNNEIFKVHLITITYKCVNIHYIVGPLTGDPHVACRF